MTTYSGPVGFLYALSGTLNVQTNAGQQSLRQDDAVLVAANNTYSLKSSATEPTLFLHFVLGRSSDLNQLHVYRARLLCKRIPGSNRYSKISRGRFY